MIDVKDIFNSWVRSINPTDEQLSLANARFEVCLQCEFKRETISSKDWSLVCGACGCPLKKKIYSTATNPCPKEKWKNIDKTHGLNPSKKNTSTLF